MRYKKFGALDKEVSVVGFGCAALSGVEGGYGFGHITTKEACSLVHQALDAGINLFDTAPIYGFGASEQRLGKALKGMREKAFLVTKSGVTWDLNKRSGIDNRAEVTQKMLEQSLKDLQTEQIDLYMIHWPDPNVDIRYPMEVLRQAKEEGKIAAIGLSNTYPEDYQKALEVERIDVLQGQFNVFERYAKDVLFSHVRKDGLGFMGYGTLDKGILTGKITREERNFDKSDVRSHATWWTDSDREPKFRAMDALQPLLHDTGHSGLELALGYVLSHDEVTTALCGMRKQSYLDSIMEALSHLPSREVLLQAEQILIAHYFAA